MHTISWTSVRPALLLAGAFLLVTGCTEFVDGNSQTTTEEAVLDTAVLGEILQAPVEELMPATATELSDDAPMDVEAELEIAATPEVAEAVDEIASAEPTPFDHVVAAARGAVMGQLRATRGGGGVFFGRWENASGDVLGGVRGEYRPLPRPALPDGVARGGVFTGRYLDTSGQFRGRLVGRYGYNAAGEGRFFGRWYDRDEHLVGALAGSWRESSAGVGGFAGHWVAFDVCTEIDSLPALTFDVGDTGGFDNSDLVLDADAPQPDPNRPDPNTPGSPPCIDPNIPFGVMGGHYHPRRPDPNSPPDPNAPAAEESLAATFTPPLDGGMRGRWRSAVSGAHGPLVGRYERFEPPTPEDDVADHDARVLGVFYGKYADEDGVFGGFIRGAWGRSTNGVGVYRGEYLDASGVVQGEIRGRWGIGLGRPGGPFRGAYVGDPDLTNE